MKRFLRRSDVLLSLLLLLLVIWQGGRMLQQEPLPKNLYWEWEVLPEPLQKEDLLHAVSSYRNSHPEPFELRHLVAVLKKQPWVSRVDIRRLALDRLRIAVAVHQPLVRWNDNGLISTTGKLFRPLHFDGVALPLLRADDDSWATRIFAAYKRWQGAFSTAGLRLSEMAQDARLSWTLRFGKGLVVHLGRDEVDTRVDRFVAAYQQYPALFSAAAVVDMRYADGFALATTHSDAQQPVEEDDSVALR